MTWDESVRDVIEKRWSVGKAFSLDQVYALESHFSKLFPSNHHVRAKLRQVLQHPRDEGLIEFVDDNAATIVDYVSRTLPRLPPTPAPPAR